MRDLLLSLLAVVIFLPSTKVSGQCNLYPISIEQRIDHSELIVEATITDQFCFESQIDKHIYTSNTLKIHKIFKGEITDSEIYLISPGGVVGDKGESLNPSIHVRKNILGTFFLNTTNLLNNSSLKQYEPYSGPQGCIYIDRVTSTGNDAFFQYHSMEEIYKAIHKTTGIQYKSVSAIEYANYNQDKSAAPSIDSIRPINVTAGTGYVLSIFGSNFGSSRGSGTVEFRNASTGATWVEPYSKQYKSWTDNRIDVVVNDQAGTGAVRVTKSGTDTELGLVVKYSWLNLENADDGLITLHRNNNGAGGFTWRMSNGFNANTDAKNSIVRALNTWTTKTCINWSNGTNTSVDADAPDGINNIRFGKTGELSTGVLAHTRNYWTNCSNHFAYTVEIDLTFSSDRSWNYGTAFPAFNQYDIESVALHELGHAHEMGHVINGQNIMHATFSPGQVKRTIIDDNISAGTFIMIWSSQKSSCGPDEMIPKSGCVLPVGVDYQQDHEDYIQVFPNPFSGTIQIKTKSGLIGPIEVYDNVGRLADQIYIEKDATDIYWNAPSSLMNGIYFLRFQDIQGVYSRAVILSR